MITKEILKKKKKILNLLKKHESPFYIFDKKALLKNIEDFKEAFSAHVPRSHFFYAVKSNPYPPLLSEVVKRGLGIDASSGLELKKALNAGSRKILFTGPGKRLDEIEAGVRYSPRVIINTDSPREIEKINEIAKKRRKKVTIGIRIYTEHHGKWNKFGTALPDLGTLWNRASKMQWVMPIGIQTHMSWTQDAAPYENVIREIGAYLNKNKLILEALRFIDLGGGFSTEYPLQKYAKKIGVAAKKHIQKKDIDFYFEPGRVLCHSSMHILLRVVDVKGAKVAITDGGTNIIGWIEDNYEPTIINLTRPSSKKTPFFIYGSLCTPEDIWGRYCYASTIKEGDYLLIPNHGAYTYTYASAFIKEFPRVYKL